MFNYKKLHFAEKELKLACNDIRENDYVTDDFGNAEEIENFLSDIRIITAFGEGFWAGFHGEYTLIYHKPLDSFFWIYLCTGREYLEIRKVKENDAIFPILDVLHEEHHQFDAVDSYFEEDYSKLPTCTVKDIGISSYSDHTFMEDIWWKVQSHFHRIIRHRLATYVKEAHIQKEIEFKEEFVSKYTGSSVELVRENKKVYALFPDGTKIELLLEKKS